MRRKAVAMLACFLISLILTACYDAKEIGNLAYVTMIGIEQGVSDRLRVTFQIPRLSTGGGEGGEGSGGGGGGEKEKEKETLTVEAPSLLSAVALANTNMPKTLNFMHLKAFVISEQFAVSGKTGEYVAPIARYNQIRRTTRMIVCKGSAEEFIKATKPYMGGLITQTFEDLFGKSRTTGFFPDITFQDFYDGMKTEFHNVMGTYAAVNKGENYEAEGKPYEGKYKVPGDYYAGDVPRIDGQEVEFLGCAVADGDKMVGKLTGFETQMMLLLRRELKRAAFTIPDPLQPELIIPIELKEFEDPQVKIDIGAPKTKIRVKLELEGDITTIQSRINYEEPEKKKIIETAFEQYIQKGMERTIEKCQTFRADVFKFSQHAVRQFLTIQEWERYNWDKRFAEADIKVEVDFMVRRTGRLLKSSPIKSSEGIQE